MRACKISLALTLGLSGLAAPAAMAAPQRLTDHAGEACSIAAPAPSRNGLAVAFESTCDLTGANEDGNREIFQVNRQGFVTQLTDTAGCTNANPSSNLNGALVAFDSDCDTGANADRNVEIFVTSNVASVQVTDSTFCTSLAPSISSNGGLVSFDSDCDLTGANLDQSVEIFRSVVGGPATQLTDDRTATGCASINAWSDAPGTTVVFESDCDLVGSNADQVNEIFRSRSGNVLNQLTSSPGEPCTNVTPVISLDGRSVVFSSDCDLTDENVDLSSEIFGLSSTTGLAQLTDDVGTSGCESLAPSAATADRVVYYGYCNPTGENNDGNLEVFSRVDGNVAQLTQTQACWSTSPKTSGDGTTVFYLSSCNLSGSDSDGEPDIYVDSLCSCGAPVNHGEPTATEANYTLNAAVGTVSCALCECDVNGDQQISALDALLILNKAIGQPIDFACD